MRKAIGMVLGGLTMVLVAIALSAQIATADQWEVVRCNSDGTYDCKPGCTFDTCCDGEM